MQQKSLSTQPVAIPTQQKIIMAKSGKICISMLYTFLVSLGCPLMLTLLFLPPFKFFDYCFPTHVISAPYLLV